jgi:transcriptional regulator with XRE-family HTH domain
MFINNLRNVREKKGISQLELSRITRIAPANICNIENGRLYPYPGWRKRLLEALEVKEEDLFPDIE